jgi:hypothetical protein
VGNARVVKVMFGISILLLVPTTAYALQEQIVTSVMKHAPALGATAAPPAAVALLLLALVLSIVQPNLAFTLGLTGACFRLTNTHCRRLGELSRRRLRLNFRLWILGNPALMRARTLEVIH